MNRRRPIANASAFRSPNTGSGSKKAPATLLDDERDAPREYHDGLTVSKTFALAIDEATKLHPIAERLIVYAALLAPEPIPLFLFVEARQWLDLKASENGLWARFLNFFKRRSSVPSDVDEAVAALRAFALIDREMIPDERNPEVATDCIRLHRLVRQVIVARQEPAMCARKCEELISALAKMYPEDTYDNPVSWPTARRLDAIALDLAQKVRPGDAAAPIAISILNHLAHYRHGALARYADARALHLQALKLSEALGPDTLETATASHCFGFFLQRQGELELAGPYCERALAIREKKLGPDHLETARALNNLGTLYRRLGSLEIAQRHFDRALKIRETQLGVYHAETALSVNNLAMLFRRRGDLSAARSHYELALRIREKVLGPNHPDTATSLNNLGDLLEAQGDLAGARPYYERALAIREKVLGPEHPNTATSLNNLGGLLQAQGDLAGAAAVL